MSKEEFEKMVECGKLKIGETYWFSMNSRKKRKRGVLTSLDSYYTGMSLYNGTRAIEFKTKNGTKWSLSLYGLGKIEPINN